MQAQFGCQQGGVEGALTLPPIALCLKVAGGMRGGHGKRRSGRGMLRCRGVDVHNVMGCTEHRKLAQVVRHKKEE